MKDPASDLITFLTSGENLPAIGALLVLIVGFLRNVLLARVAWCQTKIGGYALGWGFTTIVYVGVALEQRSPVNLRLFELALAAGLLASGVLDHLRDLVAMVTTPPKTGAFDTKTGLTDMQTAAGGGPITRMFVGFPRPHYLHTVGVAILVGGMSCANPPKPLKIIIDCTKQSHTQIESVIAQFAPLLVGSSPDWGAVESRALNAGETIGGCALAEFISTYIVGKAGVATAVGEKDRARATATLEHFRAAYGNGATYHTGVGDL